MTFPRSRFLELLSAGARQQPTTLPELALRCGAVFMEAPSPAPLVGEDADEREFPAQVAWRLANSKAGRKQGLAYCEGYASIRGIPVPRQHAWCLTPEGQVVDPSWSHGEHYFGWVIRPEFAAKYLLDACNGLMGLADARCLPLLVSTPCCDWQVSPAGREPQAMEVAS